MDRPIVSEELIRKINPEAVELPPAAVFAYPEKVLQFGTGVLLRALPDYFIDKANKRGIFKGRVVVVKSTRTGHTTDFSNQDNLYTICVRGIESGRRVEDNILNASISRVISAHEDWQAVLACAANPDLQVIISNTTEVGLVLEEDDITKSPPTSFPGKLLAFLYERYRIYGRDPDKGFVIIPTELFPDNGERLKSILTELANRHKLESAFMDWLYRSNDFCNSLVDRIVPGKLPASEYEKTSASLGYEDELMIMAEVYRLWAVESSNPRVRQILSFSQADPGMVIAPDIHIFRELKLRILNGSHTLSCGLAVLAGFTTVREAMEDPIFAQYVESLMKEEIVPVILESKLTRETALQFADSVLDRYRNPYLDHQWLSITMQFSSKMKMRDVPLLFKYYELFGRVPRLMSMGWAGHLLFMKSAKAGDQQFYGEFRGKPYLVNDNRAAVYAAAWASDPDGIVQKILSDVQLWGDDLAILPGFVNSVLGHLRFLDIHGAKPALQQLFIK